MKTFLKVLLFALTAACALGQTSPGAGSLSAGSANAPGTVSGPSKLGTGGTAFTNLRHGITGALSSGTLVVADAGATANTRYIFTTHTLGTVTAPQAYYASARSAGVSFTITSANATDTSTVDWVAIEP